MPTDVLGRRIVTAAEPDAITAAQWKAAFDASIITDLDQLPTDYLTELRAGATERMSRAAR